MTASPAKRAGGSIPWLVVAGVLVAAMSLRGPIVSPTPVLRDIEADLGLSAATVALLTTAPVLAFALLTPVAALVIRRAGAEIALMISLAGVLLGTFVRALPGFGWMLTGTVVIGVAITVGNVVIPVIVRRDVPPSKVGVVTAGYVAMLNFGSLVTSLLTAPLAAQVGWPVALLLWSGITLAGILVWGAHLARTRVAVVADRGEAVPAGDVDPRRLTGPVPVVSRSRSFLRQPVVWLLTVTFASQTFMYYGLTTWLPVISTDLLGFDATAAGALASIFQGFAVPAAFLVPLLARFAPAWVSFALIAASWLGVTSGLLLAPDLMLLWLLVGAIAHAGGFVVIFTVLIQVARSDREAAGMSAMVQGGGYALGAAGGPVMGALHEATGAWTASLTATVVAAVLYTVLLSAAFVAARSTRR